MSATCPLLVAMSSARRYRILNVFNRYVYMGGEEKSVKCMYDLLATQHDVEWCMFESKDWTGPNAPSTFGQLRRIFYNRDSRAQFERVADEFKPDVAFFHNIFPVGSPSLYHAAKLRGLPVVRMAHNFRPFSVGGTLWHRGEFNENALRGKYWREVRQGAWQNSIVKSAVFALVLKKLHRSGWMDCVKQWVCISEFMRTKFAIAGVPENRLVSLRHSWSATLNPPPTTDGGYYLFLGRLVALKGIAELLRAWKMLEETLGDATPELRVAGEGELEPIVREAAQQSRHIKFLGLISGDVKADAIAHCRAMLAPSTWWEPLGLVTYEAYDFGKPMLAAASGGLTETIIDGVTGFLHEPGSAGSLAKDVQTMEMMSPQQRQAMGEAGRKWLLENASNSEWLNRFTEIVEKAIQMQREAG